jgi:hypothetical protein
MKRFAQQFKKQSEKATLSAAERFALREKLVTFMEYHPLPRVAPQPTETFSLADPFVVVRVPWRRWRVSFGMVVVALIITIPAAAEYAVPGDVLYQMKVRVNEEVRSTLARTPYERVEWETKRIERRLAEARTLARAGLLTPEAEAAVVAAVTEHQSNATAEIALLREKNNTDEVALANMMLASVFEVQHTALAIEDVTTFGDSAATTTSSLRTLASVIANSQAEFSASSSSVPVSYDRLIAEIEKQTTRAYERLQSLRRVVPENEIYDINRRLQDIESRIGTAMTALSESSTTDTTLLLSALHDIKKLLAFMNGMPTNRTITVEQIVPITLTFAERQALFSKQYEVIATQTKLLERVVATVSEEAVIEKVILHLADLKTFIIQYQTVTPDTIAGAEQASIGFQETLRSLEAILREAGGDFTIKIPDTTSSSVGSSTPPSTATSSGATGTTTTEV